MGRFEWIHEPRQDFEQRKGPHDGDPFQPSLQVALPFISIAPVLNSAVPVRNRAKNNPGPKPGASVPLLAKLVSGLSYNDRTEEGGERFDTICRWRLCVLACQFAWYSNSYAKMMPSILDVRKT